MGYYYSLVHFGHSSNRNRFMVLAAPVLAHGIYDTIAMSSDVSEGMELKHQSNKEGHVEKLLQMARKYHLYTSGGTDFHGYNKPGIKLVTAFGNMQVEYEEISPWIGSVTHMEP